MLNHHIKVQKFDRGTKPCDFKIGEQFHEKVKIEKLKQ
jgi:hypothetical protein